MAGHVLTLLYKLAHELVFEVMAPKSVRKLVTMGTLTIHLVEIAHEMVKSMAIIATMELHLAQIYE